MSKTKIGILGGSFNPPTMGHIGLAQFVLSQTDLDGIWLMPCCGHRLKNNLIPATHRINMCNIICRNIPNVKVSDYEIRYSLDGSVYHLLDLLSQDSSMQDFEFHFIIGTDNVVIFDKWLNADELKKTARFIVVPRQGIVVPEEINWYKIYPHRYLNCVDPVIEVSATEVRKMLYDLWKGTLSIEKVAELRSKISDPIFTYIATNNLYQEDSHESSVEQGRI